MTSWRCLFSAPYSFLADVAGGYQALMPTTFREIWRRGEVEADSTLTVWVPNPGQSFVIDDGVLDLFPVLEVVATPSTGSNHIDRAACTRRHVSVYSLLDNREGLDRIAASAEFTFLLVLNALRRLDRGIEEVSSGRWRSREDWLRGYELAGKQVGLVGYGRIGRRLAKYCRAFDAAVACFDPYVEQQDVPRWSLDRIFSDSDVVVVCCSLTGETRGMIEASLLERLKPNAVFVNSSRGEVLDEQGLAAVVGRRPDLRVGVDVLAGEVSAATEQSPLMPLHRAGQIVVTPHIAGATVESQRQAAAATLDILRRHYSVAPTYR
jgi:D-3-phosphoglycerate dehydrogenase / 2-oxoglutarate reductase